MSATDDRFPDVPAHGGIEGFEPSFVDVEGTRTRYYDVGDGEPLVLVHGGNWSGLSNANVWSTALDPLAERFRVIAFDRIGCGLTDNPDDPEAYTYMTEIEHALAVLDALGLDSVHMAGSSRGAGHAARLAVEAPDRVRTLVMLNSGTFGPPTGHKPFRRDRVFERYKPEGFEPTTPEYSRYRYEKYCVQLEHITEEFCRANAALESRPKAREMAETMAGETGERWQESLREQMRHARREVETGALSMPVLYVCGRNDLMVPLEMAIAACDLLAQENPAVRMKLFQRCGHLIHREYPEEFGRTLVGFVDHWH